MRALAVAVLLLACVRPAAAWDDVTGDHDMPWLGKGGRARLLHQRSSCFMCPTGYTSEQRWGAGRWTGEEPYATVQHAFAFLERAGVLATWPEALGEGSYGDGARTIDPRAAPYRFTIVMIQPTVVVMRFDLGALVHDFGEPAQALATPFVVGPIEWGTHIPGGTVLEWFSPEANQPPTPVRMTGPDRGEITVTGIRLVLERRDGTWTVSRP